MKSQTPKTDHTPSAARPAPPPNFDTMGAMRMLMKTGFTQDQAGAIVGTMRDSQCELATKTDLDQAVGVLRAEIDQAFSGLRAEMAAMRLEWRGEIKRLEGEMKDLEGRIERQFTQLYRHLWISTGMIITAITGILGMMTIFSG